jgi:hypothetical protein
VAQEQTEQIDPQAQEPVNKQAVEVAFAKSTVECRLGIVS